MSLPRPIVAYQKRTSDHPDPFGAWCKLHHTFFTHLAEARLSGAAYKVVLQVLCASFHFGQYRPVSLSLEQFQRSQHVGRKAVIEGLRQALVKGILYEEEGWQKGGHAPKQYGLVFYRALAAGRGEEDQHPRQQGMALLRGGAGTPVSPGSAPGHAGAQATATQENTTIEPYHRSDEGLRATTGAESEPVEGALPARTEAGSAEIEPVTELFQPLADASGAEIEPVPVGKPHQCQCGNRTSAGVLTAPAASLQDGRATRSAAAQERKEERDERRTLASLARPPVAAQEELTISERLSASSCLQPPSSAETMASMTSSSLIQQADDLDGTTSPADLATLRAELERRQAAVAIWRAHGVEQIQAKIAARLELHRLERQIEEREAVLALQDPMTQAQEGGGENRQPDGKDAGATPMTSAPEPAATVPLQVTEEQLAAWQADVVAQRKEVARVKAQHQAVTEQLQRCHVGQGTWGALVREQRFLAREVEEQETQLERYERFVVLIEQGATKEEACEQLLDQPAQATPAEESVVVDVPPAEATAEDQACESLDEPAPRLEGQQLRQALFTTLAQLFTNGDPRHIDLERGKFNRAIKNLVMMDIQPGDVPVLRATFQRLWPKATCTALGLANNLPLLIDKAQLFGWQLR